MGHRRGCGYDVLEQQTLAQLQTLPNVDAAIAADLMRLGVTSVDDLSRRDPHELYDRLDALDGVRDPRVLQTYAAAIHAARRGDPLPWYGFADARRRAQDGPRRPWIA